MVAHLASNDIWTQDEIDYLLEKKKHLSNMIPGIRESLKEFGNEDAFYDCYISGGAIASILQNEIPNDIDLYFVSVKNAEYFKIFFTNPQNKIKYSVVTSSDGRDSYNGPHVFVSNNAATLASKLQLIYSKHGIPKNVTQTFDLLHCISWYSPSSDKLYTYHHIFDVIKNKQMIQNTKYPVSPKRIAKFKSRGYSIPKNLLTYDYMNKNLIHIDDLFPEKMLNELVSSEKRYCNVKTLKVTV
jgi:hypothetical protein